MNRTQAATGAPSCADAAAGWGGRVEIRHGPAGCGRGVEIQHGPAGWGGRVEIRQARTADADALAKFLAGLSLRSRYLRFFTGAAPASDGALAILTGTRGNTDAVVATESGMIIGHAMAMDAPVTDGAQAVEIGVVVADAWQGNGVGAALTREVTSRAQARGATALVMEVLAENRRVLSMIAKRWPTAQHVRSGPSLAIRAEMRPSAPARTIPRS